MFKHVALIVCLAPALLLAQNTVAGDWLFTEDVYGNPLHQRLTLKVDGAALSGTLGRRPIDGTVSGNAIRFTTTPSEIAIVLGSSVEYTISEVADRNAGVAAKLKKDRLTFK